MKKHLNLILALFMVMATMRAQQNWTWMAGTGTITNVQPTYGTQGVAATSNNPGYRYFSQICTDNSGNVWLFGGVASSGYKNDLWKYDPSTGMWTYMSGTMNNYSFGNYGSQNVGSTSNYPGCRYLAAMECDNNGNIWIFGGYGHSSNQSYVQLNDMWKYNIANGEWTWVKGSNQGNGFGTYGTMGTANANNIPGSRYYAKFTKDPSGNLWMFGGVGYSNNNSGYLNDLWKFDPSTSNFTFMGGTTNVYGYSSAGSIGASSTSYYPGGRYHSGIAADASGNIWIFGGYGYTSNNNGYLNDLWRFVPSTGVWTWVSGSQNTYITGVYGTQGTASSSNYPGSRSSAFLSADNAGNLWLSPMYGYGSNNSGYLNDLWSFNITTSQWTWVKGSSSPYNYGVYGTKGVPATSNVIGGRDANAAYTKDSQGNIWLFSGYAYGQSTGGYFDDLWRFNVCASPNSPTFQNSNTSINICSGVSTTLSATTNTGTVVWYNSPTGTTSIGTGTNFVPTGLTAVGNTSLFTYYATGSISCGTSFQRSSITVTVNPTPTITVNNGSVCAGSPFVMVPTGAASYSFTGGSQIVYPSTTTNYTVTGYSNAGCTNTVTMVSSVTVAPSPTITATSGSICIGGSFTINASGANTYTYSSGNNIVSPSTSTFYTISGMSAQGCVSQSPAIVNVMVYAKPTISANSGSICLGQSFVINASGATSYVYSGGSATVSPTANTTYSLTGLSAEGCTSTNTAVVNVNVISPATITAASGSVCAGNSFTLTPSGAGNYVYSSVNPVVTPNSTTTYTINGAAFGCTAVPAVATVTVNALPIVSVNSGAVCAGESYTLSPTGATTYSFVNGGPVVTPSATTVYGIIGTNNGCTGPASSATVVVNAIPVLSASDGQICAGDDFVIMPSGADVYTITGGSYTVSPTTTSSYTLSGESTAGCEAADIVVSVTVNALPALNPVATSTTLCAGETVTITVGTAASYMWSNSNSNSPVTTTSTAYVVTPGIPTTYSVTGFSAEGCMSSAAISLNVQACLGVKEETGNNITIWPNPSNGVFTLQLTDASLITITNQLGQLILSNSLSAGENTINLNHCANGVYFVNVMNGQHLQTLKVVKQ